MHMNAELIINNLFRLCSKIAKDTTTCPSEAP